MGAVVKHCQAVTHFLKSTATLHLDLVHAVGPTASYCLCVQICVVGTPVSLTHRLVQDFAKQ